MDVKGWSMLVGHEPLPPPHPPLCSLSLRGPALWMHRTQMAARLWSRNRAAWISAVVQSEPARRASPPVGSPLLM